MSVIRILREVKHLVPACIGEVGREGEDEILSPSPSSPPPPPPEINHFLFCVIPIYQVSRVLLGNNTPFVCLFVCLL